MKRINKIILFVTILLFTSKVYALPAVYFDNIVFNDNEDNIIEPYRGSSSGPYYIQVSTGGAGKLTFKIYGIDLEPTKNYIVKLTSDFLSEEKKFTGEELTNGASITILDGKSTISVKVHEEGQDTTIPYKYQRDCTGMQGYCDNTLYMEYLYQIYFDEQKDYTELDNIFKEIAPEGVIQLDCVDPGTSSFSETMITTALLNKYPETDYWISGHLYNGKGYLCISKGDKDKTYEVTYDFANVNQNAKAKVEEIAKKLRFTWQEINEDYSKRFIMEDLESINYLYNTGRVDEAMISIVNYSSAIHKLTDNTNIDFIFDVRAGGSDSNFYEMNLGPINILYDGIVYDYVDPIGYALNQIIYIPNDTTKTRDAFINAAKERINKYLKGINIEITYGGNINDLEESQYSWESYNEEIQSSEYHPLFDMDKTNGEWYNIKIGDNIYPYFIVLDSSKMNTPYVKSVDINTNIYVMTDAFDAPLDSRITANKLSEDSSEYKELSKKINIIKGLAYNLNLYSNSLDMYVSKLTDGSFKVYIPVDKEIANKNLIAVYIKEDGTLENHPIKVENGYAVFETNHFSTYSIVEDTKNPKTGDSLLLYIMILVVGLIGFISGSLYLKSKNKKRNKID